MNECKPEIKFVIDEYIKAVNKWSSKINDLFSWPDDALGCHKWQYWVHCRWVRDWNATGREISCVEFLLDWLTEDNILRAWRDCDEWENENVILRAKWLKEI